MTPLVVDRRTALQAAAGMWDLRIVELLLKGGADIIAPGSERQGKTALQAAAAT